MNRLKQLRTLLGLSQTQFAEKIHMTSSHISRVEKGLCNLSDDAVDKICDEFSVNKKWLLTGEGEPGLSPVDKSEFGPRIKKLRKSLGLTQPQFGEKIGFNKKQVYNVESGNCIPSEDFLRKVAKAFDVSISWLKTGCDDVNDRVDDKLIEWLNEHPDVVRKLRREMG